MRHHLQPAQLAVIILYSALTLTMTFSYSLASFADTAQKPKALMDAKAEPNFENSEIKGFRITRIRENSIYAKAGLVNNDIIESINGKALQNAESVVELLKTLKSDATVTLKILRGGAEIELTLEPQKAQ
ncbi:MAG TPA: PDZ domain-containing protein [Oligoflexus sp.]|uniref:PDZ domain-containing protein n=1 Tax=Oligoflexus sp. TaxID=1971216 RepID=UPI002D7F3879|nr:PDZ domain-containing protein [Oligoflexus sp.]HET9239064.1 PDZ domain-containing protein [Oligoflexus sp.]